VRIARIDVFAEGDWTGQGGKRIPWRLVLEAKIDALEGEEQLSRLDDWIDSLEDDRQTLRVFLTPEGRKPDTSQKKWFPLKFQELVETFRAASEELRNEEGYYYLRFYLAGVLRDICRWPIPMRPDYHDPYSVLDYLTPLTGQ
jgi:hypothetical protein